MSLHEYVISRKLSTEDPPFYALLMAAMRQADSMNVNLLRGIFPGIWQELQQRYDAPGGCLNPQEVRWLEKWEEES